MKILIKKDNNYRSNHLLTRFKLGNKWRRRYMVEFDSSAFYHLVANRTQVNKLVGIGHLHHHVNSVRVGWRNTERGTIELVAYIYKNESMEYHHIADVGINEKLNLEITYSYSNATDTIFATISLNGVTRLAHSWCAVKWYERIPFLYECFPFFGGYMPAPHNITIQIKRLQ